MTLESRCDPIHDCPVQPPALNDQPGLPEGFTLPIALTGGLRLTPEAFADVCAVNSDEVLKPAADGSPIPMAPTGSETSGRNADPLVQIQRWARASGHWRAFDSCAGFRLPDNSVLRPDAPLVALERWRCLSERQRNGVAPLRLISWWRGPVRAMKVLAA